MKKILLLLLFLVLGCSFKTIEPKSSLSDSKGFKFDNRFVNTFYERVIAL